MLVALQPIHVMKDSLLVDPQHVPVVLMEYGLSLLPLVVPLVSNLYVFLCYMGQYLCVLHIIIVALYYSCLKSHENGK